MSRTTLHTLACIWCKAKQKTKGYKATNKNCVISYCVLLQLAEYNDKS